VVQDCGKGGRFRPPFAVWPLSPLMLSFEIKDLAVSSLQVFEK
jgi:hypothetical protein